MVGMPKQGDIILVSFDPSKGHEQRKTRPALVISSDKFNDRCNGLTMVCPIAHGNDFPLNIAIPETEELKTGGKVLCAQLRTLDIKKRGWRYLEHVSDTFMSYILDVVKACL